MANRIISSAVIGSFVHNGKNIAIKYATKTDAWIRPSLPPMIQGNFKNAAMKADDIPETATTVIMAEKERPSRSYPRPHFTVVYEDKNGTLIRSAHVYPKVASDPPANIGGERDSAGSGDVNEKQ